MNRPGTTRPFREANGEVTPGSIAEVNYFRLGGIEQWVMIRGESLANPPLILLYGGPGLSETPLFRRFNAVLEKAFTVVYWDQRGSGKSFNSWIPRSTMTVDQFLIDLDELVEAVLRRTGKTQVAIFGHSWGSALGVLYTTRFPQKVAVYAGSGQIGDWPAAEAASYAFALKEAARVNNQKAVNELRDIGPPPYGAKSLWIERTWLQRFEGRLSPSALWEFGRGYLAGPESSILDVPNLLRGFRWSLDVMWDEVSQLNLHKTAPALQVPVFFLLGRHDHWVPPETSVTYLDALKAPAKTLIWFEKSGHEPFMDEPAKFNASMVNTVRPVLT